MSAGIRFNGAASGTDAAKRWRPGKRVKIGALVLAVLLVVGVTVGFIVTNLNRDAPLAEVRAYVDAIARGDASAANAMVDPARPGSGVDTALLTDEVMRSAKQRITVEDVRLSPGADPSADTVEVLVQYALVSEQPFTATLRAQRAGSAAGVLERWRVIDPLLVPAVIETNVPSLGTASLGPATVPTSGITADGWPERRLFVYPAVYEVRGHKSRYLASNALTMPAIGHQWSGTVARPVFRTTLHYEATRELVDAVNTRIPGYVTACFAALPRTPRDCPRRLTLWSQNFTGIRLERQPRVEEIEVYDRLYDEATKPSLLFSPDNGAFSYIADGKRQRTYLHADGWILVSPDDHLTITFTSQTSDLH
jgi:hypothetical protein